jgi:hypothetical protein
MNDPGITPDGRPAGAPYGPATPSIRRFLVQLAALDAEAREAVVERFAAVAGSRAFVTADAALAETIERSGRADAQDALAGPLLQLVRRREQAADSALPTDAGEDEEQTLEALAEPALAALLALLVRDLLAPAHFRTLYGAFDPVIPADPPGHAS